jgi:hypothetical protein
MAKTGPGRSRPKRPAGSCSKSASPLILSFGVFSRKTPAKAFMTAASMPQMRNNVKKRMLVIRLALIFLWIGLGVLIFVLNRGHALLVDNRDTDNLRATDLIKVTVDGKSLDFFRGDRDIFRVRGSRHRLRVEYMDGKPPFETVFSLALRPDMYLLSIPKITNGLADSITVFRSQPESRNVEEEEIPSGAE